MSTSTSERPNSFIEENSRPVSSAEMPPASRSPSPSATSAADDPELGGDGQVHNPHPGESPSTPAPATSAHDSEPPLERRGAPMLYLRFRPPRTPKVRASTAVHAMMEMLLADVLDVYHDVDDMREFELWEMEHRRAMLDGTVRQRLKAKGDATMREKSWWQAFICYSAIPMKDPEYAEIGVWMNRSLAALKLNAFYLAILDAEQALEIDPNHIKALFRLGRAMRHMGVGDQAEENINAALTIEPENKEIQAEFMELRINRTWSDEVWDSWVQGNQKLDMAFSEQFPDDAVFEKAMAEREKAIKMGVTGYQPPLPPMVAPEPDTPERAPEDSFEPPESAGC